MAKELTEANLNEELEKAAGDAGQESPDPEITSEAEPEEAAPEPPPQPAWRSIATEHGLNIPDDMPEDQVFRQVFGDAVRYGRSGSQAERWMQERLPYESEFQQWLSQRQQEAQAKQQQDKTKPFYADYWKPPVEFDPAFNSIQVSDTGELVAPRDAAPDLLHRFRQYAGFDKQIKMDFFKNPHEFMKESITRVAKNIFEEEYARRRAAEMEQQSANQIVGNADFQAKLLIRDQQGKATGYTPWGNSYQHHLRKAVEAGMPTQMQHEYAEALADRQFPQEKPSNGKKSKTAREKANSDFYSQHEKQVGGGIPGAADRVGTTKKVKSNDPREALAMAVKDIPDEDFAVYAADFAKRRN